MSVIIRVVGFISLAFSAAGMTHADVYKCSTQSGVVYQDTPCLAGKEDTIKKPYSPPTSDAIESAIAARKVRIGMSKQHVMRAWGKPTDTSVTVSGDTVIETWTYNYIFHHGGINFVGFTNGIVTSIH